MVFLSSSTNRKFCGSMGPQSWCGNGLHFKNLFDSSYDMWNPSRKELLDVGVLTE